MGEKTKIEYLQPDGKTWSPWFGCSKVSPGCEHCFAEGWAKRTGFVEWGPGKSRRLNKDWDAPGKWNAKAKAAGTRYRILTDLCDPFDSEVPGAWYRSYIELIEDTLNLDWLVLTKRIRRVPMLLATHVPLPPNVWLGISVCNQEEADRDIPILLSIPATKHWISYEPALEPVDFRLTHRQPIERQGVNNSMHQLHWIVAGCESGPKRRPSKKVWFWSVMDQCKTAGIPFFLKQIEQDGKVVKMPELCGQVWKEIPE